MPFREGADWT